MTSTKEAMERLERHHAMLVRPINYAAFLGDSDGAQDAEDRLAKGLPLAADLRLLLAHVSRLEGALSGLLEFAEAAEDEMLVGDEGCVWAVEAARQALTGDLP